MPPVERDAPVDRPLVLRHQHSASSDQARALIPMWDSSDPERAPPPLPLNPQSPISSRTGTSAAIQSAHAALNERAARESTALVPALTKRVGDVRSDVSPERKGSTTPSHRRMQSLQPGSVRDLSLMIESGRDSVPPPQQQLQQQRSPEKKSTADDKFTTPGKTREPFILDPDQRRDDRALVTASPLLGPSLTPIVRPTARRNHQSILGENTPPQSATMLALQNMTMTTPAQHVRDAMTTTTAAPPPAVPSATHENALANMTNNTSTALVRAPQALDALSGQILSLTSIATSLQKEMGQLSRRSRDNATDLLSLKEATNSRDEDIRKSLRELTSNLAEARSRASTRDLYGGSLLLDSKPHSSSFSHSSSSHPYSSHPLLGSPPSISKLAPPQQPLGSKISLPRIPSPNSFAASLDRDSGIGTPSIYGGGSLVGGVGGAGGSGGGDAPATMALLEKIVRDMGTKEGQDTLLGRLGELSQRLAGMATASMVDELRRAVEQDRSAAAAAGNGNGRPRPRTMSFDEEEEEQEEEEDRGMRTLDNYNNNNNNAISNYHQSASGALTTRVDALLSASEKENRRSPGPSVVNEEVIKVIKTVKDSVAQGGGLTAEVKALVRELRGEVLGMGREIGRRLDETAARSLGSNKSEPATATREDMTRVVEEGLDEMKAHINQLVKEHRRQSTAATQAAAKANAVDYHEVYNAMRAALRDQSAGKPEELRREDVMQAVKEAWESYKPEIEIQTVGLERDEILACLQEGLASHGRDRHQDEGAIRDEVYEAVVEGLKHFVPPRVETPASLSRDEILEAVRECLEEFEFPNPFPEGAGAGAADISKADVLDAVRIGLHAHEMEMATGGGRETITRDDVVDAVHEGLQTSPPAVVGLITKEDVIDAVQIGLEGLDFPSCDAGRDGLTREDVVLAIRGELDGFESHLSNAMVPASQQQQQQNITKEDVLDAVHRGLESFDFAFPEPSSSRGVDMTREDILDAVREGLRDLDIPELSSALVHSSGPGGGQADNKEVVERLQDILDSMRAEFKAVSDEAKQNVAANGRDTEQVLDATKDGFDRLRAEIEGYVDRACGEAGQEEFMVNLVHTLDGFRDEVADLVAKSSDSSREVIRDEIESLRDAVNSSLVPAVPQGGGAGGNTTEILEALQDGLSGLRSEINSRPLAGVNEILDAMQEGLGDLRGSIDRLADKPADLTANDEILDALKAGLDSVRADIEGLREESRSNDRALAVVERDTEAPAETETARREDIQNLGAEMAKREDIENLGAEMVKREDIENLGAEMVKQSDIQTLEALLTELRVKVEGMEMPVAARAEETGPVSNGDLALMEETLRGLQDAVASVTDTLAGMSISVLGVSDGMAGVSEKVAALSAPEARAATDPSTREDVQAIETILRNTKGRLDDLIDGEQAVRKEHVDVLETLILETRESLTDLSAHLDTVSKKEDLDCVGSLVTQVVAAFDEMKDRHEKALEDPEKVTKTDVEAVEAVCHDVKNLVEQVVKADLAALPSKEDLTRIEDLLKEFKGKMDEENESKSQALELRQVEMTGVGERVTEVKAFLEAFQGLVKDRLDQGANGMDSIHSILDTLGETMAKNATVGDDLKDMFLVMKDEFEEAKAGAAGARLESDEKAQQATDTVLARFDERVGELAAKYDDFQLAVAERASKGEERDAEMEAAVVGTKAVADELKLLIDTLGAAVTESMEKMEEASKTVFTRVEDLLAKSDESQLEGKAEHELTRDRVGEALTAVEGLKGDAAEFQPQMLESIKDVLLMVGEHFEHHKAAVAETQEKIAAKIDEARPEPFVFPEIDIPRYDDAPVHEKLDRLVGHTAEADRAFAQLETLDKVHDKVVQTAAEIAAFLAAQTQRIEDEREDREKTLLETNEAIERRLGEREVLEGAVAALREENERLRLEGEEELARLRTQREAELEMHKAAREEELAAHTTRREVELTAHQTAREEEVERLKLEREEEVERLKLEREEEVARLKTEREAEMDRLKLEREEEAAKLKLEREEETSRLKAEREEEAARLAADREAEMERMRSERETEMERLRLEHEEEEGRFRASLREEEERYRTSLREQEERSRAGMQEEEVRFKASLAEEAGRHKALLQQQEERLTSGLREEEERLKAGLAALRAEQESLHRQKMRLSADLSSLETALHLRREELHDMEARAEGLERRILEGVMDHSRVLLMAKANRAAQYATSAKNGGGRGDPMARKRVSSHHSQKPDPNTTPTKPVRMADGNSTSKPKAAFNITMAGTGTRTPAAGGTTPNRRILSLSQITNNSVSGPIKRSQSVRQAGGGGYRKSSWAPAGNHGGKKGYGDLSSAGNHSTARSRDGENEKENALKESDEEDEDDYATPRRVSHDRLAGPPEVVDIFPPPTTDSEMTLAESELTYLNDEYHMVNGAGAGKGAYDDGGESEEVSEAETETARPGSRGTTVVTGAGTGTEYSYDGTEGEGYTDGEEGEDDGYTTSEWTESNLGTESVLSEDMEGAGAMPEARGDELVVYGAA